MNDVLPAEFLLDDYPPAIRETGRALRSLILKTVAGNGRNGPAWLALDRVFAT